MTEQPLWQPDPQQIKNSQLSQFTDYVNRQHNLSLQSYNELHQYSIENRASFWRDVLEYCDVVYHQNADQDLIDNGHMIEAQWFNGMTLNFAENLLLRKSGKKLFVMKQSLTELAL